MGRRLALLVATYDYQDGGLRRLTAPAHDAEAFASVLRDPEIAGFEVTTLINQPHHRVGEVIGDFYRDRRRDDLTLLYFTGHGLKDDSGRLYLAMTNTRRDSLLFTALAAEQIDQAMEGCASRQKVLILDCCYSGAFPAGRLAKGDTAVHALERFQGRGRTVLTASDATQYSFEGDRAHGQATQSVFTRYLVAGLRDGSADLDGDGDITLDELYGYVHDRVVDEMPQQRPKRLDSVEGRIVIARNVNWTLPAHLRNAVTSPIATDRLAALDGLAHLHRIGNEQVRSVVLEEFRRLADDDSKLVSTAAAAHLRPTTPVAEAPSSVPSPTPSPVSTPAVEAPRPPVEPPVREVHERAQDTIPEPRRHTPVRLLPRTHRARAITAAAVVLALAAGIGVLLTTGGPGDKERSCPAAISPSATLSKPGEWIEFSPDKKTFLTVDPGSDNIIRLWDANLRRPTDAFTKERMPNNARPFSPDGRLLVTQSATEPTRSVLVRVRDLDTPRTLDIDTGHTGVVSAAVNPEGTMLATADASHPNDDYVNPVRLWDIRSGKRIAELKGHTNGVGVMEFSSDGTKLVTGGNDDQVKLWDVAAAKAIVTIPDSSAGEFSPDGKIFATGSSGQKPPIRMVDTTTGKTVSTLADAVAGWFSPDGKTLAVFSPSRQLRLWDLRRRELVADVARDALLIGFSPSGAALVVAVPEKDVWLWDTAAHKRSTTLTGIQSVEGAQISADGKSLAIVQEDDSIKFWNIADCS